MLISEEKGPLVITVYWQLGVCNSSLLKWPITSDLKCAKRNRPGNTVPPVTLPTAFCSRTGGLQRERERERERGRLWERKWVFLAGKGSNFLQLITFCYSNFFFSFPLHLVFRSIKICMFGDVHWRRYCTLEGPLLSAARMFIHATVV